MSFEFYKILHLAGVFGMLLALGAAAATGPQVAPSTRRLNGILHGVGMLLILVAGFGMLARGNLGFPGWVMVKIPIYLVIGALPMMAQRRQAPLRMILIALVLTLVAAWLALVHPF